MVRNTFLALILAGVLVPTLAAQPVNPPAPKKPWPKSITAPKGLEAGPGPWSDSDDQTVWPNKTSRANGDPWLVANHDKIKRMNPRVLLINFSNEHPRDKLDRLAKQIVWALGEGSRYHGYGDEKTAPFLNYEVFKFVDLRDADRTVANSKLIPVKNPAAKSGFNMKYAAYFSDEFAFHYGVPDPREPKRFLKLDELLDAGYVHEVWFFESGNTKPDIHVGSYEVVELKPVYDAAFKRVSNRCVQGGNGGDVDQPWTGRSVRIGCINASRGPGCFMESLSHGMEGTATSNAIPYFSRYFKEFAGMDLDKRLGLPFNSLYGVNYGGKQIQYPDAGTMIVTHGGKEHTVKNYVVAGGNAHFPPNARGHYDLDNDKPVNSTIEDWRIGSGPGKRDVAKPWTNVSFRNYRDQCGDCMGPWLVYWRQNMPGQDNKQKDEAGKPMKNWWPFLFY